ARSTARVRHRVRARRVRRHGDRSGRGHGRLRGRLRAGRARRPGALLPHAGAALRRGGGPPDGPLRRRVRARESGEARAADPAAGRGSRRGGLAGGLTLVGYLGLGSNEGDRLANLRAARSALPAHGVEVLASSSVYETAPQGDVLDQPDFLNACLRVETALAPLELLDAGKAV